MEKQLKNAVVAMISQPMRGKSDEEILAQRNEIKADLEEMGFVVANTFLDKDLIQKKADARNIENIPLYAFANSIELMSACNVLVLAPGWEFTRGCELERKIANAYGLEVLDYNSIKASELANK